MARRARDFDRWVRLTLRLTVRGLFVDYEDETGHRVEGTERTSVKATVDGPRDAMSLGLRLLGTLWPAIYLPHGLAGLLRSGFADRPESRAHWLPESVYLDAPVPWLLPVFIVPPPVPFRLPWERWLTPLIATDPDLESRCTPLRQVPMPAQPPLELPLRFQQTGIAGADWFSAVRTRSWYAGNDAVREFGMEFSWPGEAPADGASQVLVRPFGAPLSQRLRSWSRTRPLLVLTIAETVPSFALPYRAPEPGVSHMLVMPRLQGDSISAAEVVSQVVYGLVHDFALHEIAWILTRTIRNSLVWIASDTRAIHALRLSGVMRRVVDDALAGRGAHGPQAGIGNAELRDRLRYLAFDFRFESRGLTAMANFLSTARAIDQQGRTRVLGSAERGIEQATESPRRADVSLEQYDAFGVLTPMLAYDRAAPLQRGWRYRLRVHIGIPDRDSSAVVGDVPAIDDLLPPPVDSKPRSIDVAVFAKRFELLSAGVQTIALPRAGASAPVYFELRAPQDAGRCDLRIALYWRNNLLQSFVLDAEVADDATAPEQGRSDKPRVLVRLDASGIDDFTAMPEVGARALSIGLNDDALPGSHTVMVKGTGWREEVWLQANDADDFMDRFRTELEAASTDPGGRFEPTLRQMAAIGHDIWDMLSLGDKSDGKRLEDLRTGSGGTVQFVRYGSGRPFPWQTVYDYGLPQGNAFGKARICRGDTPVRGPLARGQIGCPHFPGEDVVCIEGFWAARHRIELLREDRPGDSGGAARAKRASAPVPNPLVTLGIGTPSGVASRFQAALQAKLGNDLYSIASGDQPVADLIWNESARPAVLVFLSHLESADRRLRLPALLRAFDSPTTGAEISVPQLALRRHKGTWQEPQRPLVLLLACQSARRELGELTSLVDAFLQVGAAGVAGTEWDVQASLATEFGRSIIEAALGAQPATLGESVRSFLHASLRSGEALPFAFTVYGDADLTVGRPLP